MPELYMVSLLPGVTRHGKFDPRLTPEGYFFYFYIKTTNIIIILSRDWRRGLRCSIIKVSFRREALLRRHFPFTCFTVKLNWGVVDERK